MLLISSSVESNGRSIILNFDEAIPAGQLFGFNVASNSVNRGLVVNNTGTNQATITLYGVIYPDEVVHLSYRSGGNVTGLSPFTDQLVTNNSTATYGKYTIAQQKNTLVGDLSTTFTSASESFNTSPTAGNLLIAFITIDKSSDVITPPSGWNIIDPAYFSNAEASGCIVWKISTGNETSVTFQWTTARSMAIVNLLEFDGFNTIALDDYSLTTSLGATVFQGGEVTSTVADSLAISFLGLDSCANAPALSATAQIANVIWSNGFEEHFTQKYINHVTGTGYAGHPLSSFASKVIQTPTSTSTSATYTRSEGGGLITLVFSSDDTPPPPDLSVTSIVIPANGNTAAITFNVDVLPASGITGLTSTVNGVARSITSARTSSNVITITFSSVVYNGDSVNVIYSSGNITDLQSEPLQNFNTAATNNSTVVLGTVVSRWAGGVTGTSVVINAKVSVDYNVRANVYNSSNTSVIVSSSSLVAALVATNNRMVRLEVANLTPDTAYTAYIEINGVEDRTKPQTFKTFPVSGTPVNFDFAFASCAATGSTSNVFNLIRNRNFRFFCHMGDLNYADVSSNSIPLFRTAYDSTLASSTQSAFFASLPIDYVFDDHDFGPNNAYSGSASKPAAQTTYREYFPHYPLPAGSGANPIYHSFVYGRVRFVVTDNRSNKTLHTNTDDSSKTVLGATQLTWFFSELEAARDSEQVVLWINSFPWISTLGDGRTHDDEWCYYTYERNVIANWIKNNNMAGRIAILSGDAHMLAADNGTNSDYATGGGAPIPVCQAAALDRTAATKGGPYSVGSLAGTGQYGTMSVIDNNTDTISFQFRGRNISDQIVMSMDFSLNVLSNVVVNPLVSSIVVPSNGMSIVLEFDKNILPATGITGFSVEVDGYAKSVSSVSRTSSNQITLNLSSNIYSGQTVEVTYNPGNIIDEDSNALEAFALSATNNSTVEEPVIPSYQILLPINNSVRVSKKSYPILISSDIDITITLSDGGAGGTFSTNPVVLNNSNESQYVHYTPSSLGNKAISFTNNVDGNNYESFIMKVVKDTIIKNKDEKENYFNKVEENNQGISFKIEYDKTVKKTSGLRFNGTKFEEF